jgi:hypothetical protein
MRTSKPQVPSSTRALAALLALAFTLTLTGCAHVQVLLHMKLYIAKVPVTSAEVSLQNNPAIAPGEKSPLIATFTEPNGTVLTTEGAGKGKVMWSDLTVTPTVVTINKKGIVSLPHDPRLSDGKTGHIVLTVPSHPGLQAELDIPLRYDYPFRATYNGVDGNNGTNGTDGSSGTPGSPGSTDPNNPSPGGDGGSGGNGTDGTDGGDGGDAPSVLVQVTLRPGTPALLQVAVTAPGRKEHFYLINPDGGTLAVSALGGAGGSGGRGGRGGSGGSGGVGTPNGSNGTDGNAGLDGTNGSNGRAGTITVNYDPSAKPFLSIIHLSNAGAPAPTFHEQPIPPLW